jgi:hypothetical protein
VGGGSRTFVLSLTPGTTYTIVGAYSAANGKGAVATATFTSTQIMVQSY